jgi:hypothetical protein
MLLLQSPSHNEISYLMCVDFHLESGVSEESLFVMYDSLVPVLSTIARYIIQFNIWWIIVLILLKTAEYISNFSYTISFLLW